MKNKINTMLLFFFIIGRHSVVSMHAENVGRVSKEIKLLFGKDFQRKLEKLLHSVLLHVLEGYKNRIGNKTE